MELISPLLLYSAAIEVHRAYSVIEDRKGGLLPDALVTAQDCTIISALMDQIGGELVKLNCPVAAESARKPGFCMQQNVLTYAMLQRFLDEMDGRIRDEVKNTYAFSLNHLEARFFNPPEPLLGPDVALKFESAAFDIEEAGKCHALGRSTAAVFHAFRVLELGIKALAKCLSVENLEKPKMKNWGFILDEMEKSLKAKFPADKDVMPVTGSCFGTSILRCLP